MVLSYQGGFKFYDGSVYEMFDRVKFKLVKNLNLKEGKAKFLLRFACSCKQNIFKHNLCK